MTPGHLFILIIEYGLAIGAGLLVVLFLLFMLLSALGGL